MISCITKQEVQVIDTQNKTRMLDHVVTAVTKTPNKIHKMVA